MRRIVAIQGWVSAVIILFIACIPAVQAELIEPTRTQYGSVDQPGVLNVYSEPPGLELFIDEKFIGKTPVKSVRLSAGEHQLRIGDTERKVNIASGKNAVYSWFKGALIEVFEPSETTGASNPPDTTSTKKTSPKATDSTARKNSSANDPFYWPLNPRGPIY
jgi:hypothetical protein